MPDNRVRDPQSGRFLSHLGALSHKADVDVQKSGLPPDEQQLVEKEALEAMESEAVKSYIDPMKKFIENWSGNLAELRKIIPMIKELDTFAQTEDTNLKDTEKKHVHNYAIFLIQFIDKKTNLLQRVTTRLKNVAKESMGGMQDSLSSQFSASPNLLVKLAGKMLARKKESPTADKAVLQTKADVLSKVMSRNAPTSTLAAEDIQPEEVATKTRKTRAKAVGKKVVKGPPKVETKQFKTIPEANGNAEGGMLDSVFSVEKEILQQVIKTNVLLDQGNKEAEAAANATELGENEYQKPITSGSKISKEPSKNETTEPKGIFGGFSAPQLIEMLGLGTFGPMLASALGTVLSGAITAAGVVAAAGIGLLIGNEIAKKLGLGGTLPAAHDLLDTKSQSLSSSLKSIVRGLDPGQSSMFGAFAGKKQAWDISQDKIINANKLGANIDIKAKDAQAQATKFMEDRYQKATGNTASETSVGENVTKSQPADKPSPSRESPVQMHISGPGLERLKTREAGGEPLKFSAKSYPDGNGYSIGYGMHFWKGQEVTATYPGTITKDQADAEMEQQLPRYENIVRDNLHGRKVQQHEFDELVAVTWNGEVSGASLAKKLSNLPPGQKLSKQDYEATGTVGGKRNPQLKAVRDKEYEQSILPDDITPAPPAVVSVPSQNRSAAPLVAAAKQPAAPIIIAPSIVSGGGGVGVGGGGSTMAPPPVRMVAENPEVYVQGLRSINVV